MRLGRRKYWIWGIGACSALLVVYAAGGFFLAPWAIERYLPSYAADHGVVLNLGDVRLNPLRFTAEADHVQVREAPGLPPFATFRQLALRWRPFASLAQRAWLFDVVSVDGAAVQAEVGPDGDFNLTRVVDGVTGGSAGGERAPGGAPRSAAQPSGTGAAPAADKDGVSLRIERIVVRNGTFGYTDRSGEEPRKLVAQDIDVRIEGLNLGSPAEGRFDASVTLSSGGTLKTSGTFTAEPLALRGQSSVTGLPVATIWQFVRDKVLVREPAGTLGAQANYRIRQSGGGVEASVEDGNARVEGLELADRAGRELAQVAELQATGVDFDLRQSRLAVALLAARKGAIHAQTAPDGTLDWGRLIAAEDGDTQPSEWNAQIEAIELTDLAVHYTHASRAASMRMDVGTANARLQLALAHGTGGTHAAVSGAELDLADIAVVGGKRGSALAAMKSVQLAGGWLDTSARTAGAERAALAGGRLPLVRTPAGRLQVTGLHAATAATGAKAGVPGPKQMWDYNLGALQVEDFDIAFADRGFNPGLRYDLEVASARIDNIASKGGEPMKLETTLRLPQGGTVAIEGRLAQDLSQGEGRIDARAVSLVPLQPLLGRYTEVTIASGTVTTARPFAFRHSAPGLQFETAGPFVIENLLVNGPADEGRLVSWKKLEVAKLAYRFPEQRLELTDAQLIEPEARLVIERDRTVNFAVLNIDDEGKGSPKPPSAAAADARATDGTARAGQPVVSLDRLRARDGILDFADLSLVLPFSARIVNIDGALLGAGLARGKPAELKFEGLIEPYGLAAAEGSIDLVDPLSHTDIRARFENVQMPQLTPYMATFLGRRIESGKLWLDLEYEVSSGVLAGENKVVLDDFRLGERVNTPSALDLPLDLAMALLTEPDGRIYLAVPVRGEVGSPGFDYGEVIRGAIGNAIGRVVSAPFRLLAGLFGRDGAGADLGTVEFEPGRARLKPQEREELARVAEALAKRPQLDVIVPGPYDSRRDGQALRAAALRRELAEALGLGLAPGEDQGPIAFADPRTGRALEAMLASRVGEPGLQAFQRIHQRETRAPQAGSGAASKPAPGPYHRAIFERLVEIEPLADAALRELAGSRADTIIEVLVDAGADRRRLASGAVSEVEARNDSIAADLALETARSAERAQVQSP